MIAETAQTQPLRPSSQQVSLLRGGWLWAARVMWVILAGAGIGFFILNTSLMSGSLLAPCEVTITHDPTFCPAHEAALAALGLSYRIQSYFFIVGVLIEIVPWILVGLLVFWRRSEYRFELFFSLIMILTPTINLDKGLGTWSLHFYPALEPFFSALELIAAILLIWMLYLFPTGRFVFPSLIFMPILYTILNLVSMVFPDAAFNPFNWLPQIGLVDNLFLLSGIASIIYRYRFQSSPTQRQQIKWLVIAFPLLTAAHLALHLIPHDRTIPENVAVHLTIGSIFYVSSMLAALSMAVSILRYRLWDIDFLINRALVYGAVTAVLGGVFVAAFFPLRALWLAILGEGREVLAAVLPAVFVALIFNPTRQRLRRFVDSRLYGIKVDYLAAARVDESRPAVQPAGGGARRTFGSCTDLTLIGRGGMGEVYRAVHPTLDQVVAIKILPPYAPTDTDVQRRFIREAQTVARLKHPHIVALHEYGEEAGQPFMVMEYINGDDLAALIKQRGRLPLAEALPLLQAIADALDYTHSQGVVHRDIKPSNVMVTHSNPPRAVLMDFGIAKSYAASTQLTHSGFIGTLDYIAPEQIQGSSQVDGRADVYSLGVMAYQMLTGEVPFKHNNPGAMVMAHLMQPPPDPTRLVPDLPEEAAEAIMQAMAKRPDQRFATAGAFVGMME